MKTYSLFIPLFFLFLSHSHLSAQAPIGVATPGSQTICSDMSITVIALSTSNGMDGSTTYAWTRNNTVNVTGIASSGTGNISGTLHNLMEIEQQVTFTITPTSGEIDGEAFTATITVNELPTVTWNNTLTEQCEDATTYALTGGTPAGGVYSGPGISGTNFNAAVAGVGTHTLTYTYTDGNGCTNSTTNTIVVNPLPTVNISVTGSSEICEGASSSILFSATPRTTVTYNVNGGSNQTISICSCGNTTLNTGTLYTTTNFSLENIAYTTGPACSQPASGTATITVNPLPTADAGPDQEICFGESIMLTATGGILFDWDNGVTNGIPFAPTTTTEYNVIVTDNVGCSDQDQVFVEVKPVPQIPTITFSSDTLFSDSDLGNQWYVDGNLIDDAEDPFFKPTITGTYYTIVTEDGCESEKSNDIFVQITGLEQNENIVLNIYPNPTEDIITIETDNIEGFSLSITSSNGKIILQEVVIDPICSVDLTSILKGVYFITIGSEDYVATKKIIKL